MKQKSHDLDCSRDAAIDASAQRLWLLNLKNGRIFPWTPILSARRDMVDCKRDGTPVNPGEIPADHPWIRQQTVALRDRMIVAGADHDTIRQMGEYLTTEHQKKLGAAIERVESMRLQHINAPMGPMVRIINSIEARANQAHAEIDAMARLFLRDICRVQIHH